MSAAGSGRNETISGKIFGGKQKGIIRMGHAEYFKDSGSNKLRTFIGRKCICLDIIHG